MLDALGKGLTILDVSGAMADSRKAESVIERVK